MRFERLVIEAGDNTFHLEFHPRLTVITGVGRLEREGLISELVGSLSSSRAGVHAEIVAENGHRFAIFRPHGARHRVVDVDASIDVSNRFADDDGTIDFLRVAGLDARTAKRRLRLTAADLSTSTHHDQIVRDLAAIDSTTLWSTADRVHVAQNRLDDAATDSGASAEDAAVVARIEERHQRFEDAQSRAEKVRKLSFAVGALAALAAVPTAMMVNKPAAMAFVIAAAVVTAISFVQNQRMERARRAEEEALSEAGAKSYLGFHLQRVNGLLDSDQARRQVAQAGADLEAARNEWHELAGTISVEWAYEHRDEIEGAARLRHDMSSFGTSMLATDDDDETAALAHALIARLTEVRTIGPAGESLPLVLDDPLAGLRPETKAPLLELLLRSSGSQQIVFLTEDDDVIDWSRVEAMTGEITVLEPTSAEKQNGTVEARSGIAAA